MSEPEIWQPDILYNWSLFIPPEKIRKPKDFLVFSGRLVSFKFVSQLVFFLDTLTYLLPVHPFSNP